jgi:hypothetical protein
MYMLGVWVGEEWEEGKKEEKKEKKRCTKIILPDLFCICRLPSTKKKVLTD